MPFVEALRTGGLLGPDLLFSHGQSFSDDALDALADHDVTIAVSVESEFGQEADPVTWRAMQHGVAISIAAASVGSLSGDMFHHMQFTLKVGRGSRARVMDARGIAPTDVAFSIEDMLRIGAMGGAQSLQKEDRIGSLTSGKQADLILLSRQRVGLASGAPPASVAVLLAHTGDVDTVVIAGKVMKRGGVPVDADPVAVHRDLTAARQRARAAADPSDQDAFHNACNALRLWADVRVHCSL